MLIMEHFRQQQKERQDARDYAGVEELNINQEAMLISEAVCMFRDLKNQCIDNLYAVDEKVGDNVELIGEGVREGASTAMKFMENALKKFIEFITNLIVKLVRGSTSKNFKTTIARLRAMKEHPVEESLGLSDKMTAKVYKDPKKLFLLWSCIQYGLMNEEIIKIGNTSATDVLALIETYANAYTDDVEDVIELPSALVTLIKNPGELFTGDQTACIRKILVKLYENSFTDLKFKAPADGDIKKAVYDFAFNPEDKVELSGEKLIEAVSDTYGVLTTDLVNQSFDKTTEALEKAKKHFTGTADALGKANKATQKKVGSNMTKEEKKNADAASTLGLLTQLGEMVGTYGAAMVQHYALSDLLIRTILDEFNKQADIIEKAIAEQKKAPKKDDEGKTK